MPLPTISLGQAELANFDNALQKEWLVTNGLGGYAASTVLGVNTRKYHGLLVAALQPPGNRTVCLAKMDEEVNVDGQVFLLGANEFRGVFFPQGYKHLTGFSVSPYPQYRYSVAEVKVEKTVFMPRGRNATAIVYHVTNGGGSQAELKFTPLVTCRHYHATLKRTNNHANFSQQNSQSAIQVAFPRAKITVQATTGEFLAQPNWIESLVYREDLNRVEYGTEDCYQPGFFRTTIPAHASERFAFFATAEENSQTNRSVENASTTSLSEIDAMYRTALDSKRLLIENFYAQTSALPVADWLSWVRLAADAFVVQNYAGQKSVIAGYHWYEPWGRDTFISMPGLMLVTGRFEDAKEVISSFNRCIQNGLIPNYLGDRNGHAAYNTVDATLWFVNAVLQYIKYTNDFAFVRADLWENLKSIVENHVRGTVIGIHVDADGLLSHGERLTWMDAEVEGQAITPRKGKAVEIQALWFNALKIVQLLAARFGEENLAEKCGLLAEKANVSFEAKFWNSSRQCLFDVVDDGEVDASLRPNQLIAAALDFGMLSQEKNQQVVEIARRELVTPCGLRTLERGDPKYIGKYFGDRWSRDKAYHNGTVWPWLFGPYVKAFLKANEYTAENVEYARSLLASFLKQQVASACLGAITEIFDGDPPHMPRGCIAQAWSVGQPLGAYVEDALRVKPRFAASVLGVQDVS
jgi:predicted glycogen debranching enzyme